MSAHCIIQFTKGVEEKFNKFNNTGARTLDSIYHMTLKSLFDIQSSRFCH